MVICCYVAPVPRDKAREAVWGMGAVTGGAESRSDPAAIDEIDKGGWIAVPCSVVAMAEYRGAVGLVMNTREVGWDDSVVEAGVSTDDGSSTVCRAAC